MGVPDEQNFLEDPAGVLNKNDVPEEQNIMEELAGVFRELGVFLGSRIFWRALLVWFNRAGVLEEQNIL